MQSGRTSLFALVALPLGACDWGEQLQRLTPVIEIVDPQDPTFSICTDENMRDCSYAFGEVAIGLSKVLTFAIHNPSPVDLHIASMTLDGSPTITLQGDPPTTVEAQSEGAGGLVQVAFTPSGETRDASALTIVSDAENLADDDDIVIQLTGQGADVGPPVISVTPPGCDFGNVGVHVRTFCDIRVKNEGTQDLVVNRLAFTPGTPTPEVFRTEGEPVVAASLLPGVAMIVRVHAEPDVSGPITGVFIINSNDPITPTVEVPLAVRGAGSPTAVARVKSVNGDPNTSVDPVIEPLDDAILSADQSEGGTAAVVAAYAWEILESPVESSVTLSTPEALDTGFAPP